MPQAENSLQIALPKQTVTNNPLLYVGQESTATGKARSTSRFISSHSVKTVKYRGRVVSA